MTIMPPELSIGGTTGLSHEHSAAIDEAASWLAQLPAHQRPRPLVPALRARFGLSASQACQAIHEAGLIHARAI